MPNAIKASAAAAMRSGGGTDSPVDSSVSGEEIAVASAGFGNALFFASGAGVAAAVFWAEAGAGAGWSLMVA